MINLQSLTTVFSASVLLCLITSCGGGGGNGVSPSDPVADLQINGVRVPPEPDPLVNGASVAGVDTNSNGVRDDVERKIAIDFAADATRHALAIDHARLLQEVIVNPSPSAKTAYFDQVRCINDSAVLRELDTIARLVLDAASRQHAYGKAVAGAVISIEGC